MDATLVRSPRFIARRPVTPATSDPDAALKTVCAINSHDCKAYDAAVTLRLIRASKGLVS